MANQGNLGTQAIGIDTGHDSPRTFSGTVIGTSGDVFIGSVGAARIGDMVINSDGHSGTIVGGSSSVKINGIPAARLGDQVVGTLIGTIIGGEPTVQTG